MLKGVFDIAQNALGEMNVLIFDDLYRSGETLHAVTEIVKNKGNAKNVYVLTITKTRIKK
jgi:predicted amidophosphoribosyltransferase